MSQNKRYFETGEAVCKAAKIKRRDASLENKAELG